VKRILVAVASQHGATQDIANAIADTLRESLAATGERPSVDVLACSDVGDVSGYQAAVIGSAVYMGWWMDAARELVRREQNTLTGMPVWLFSSGPVGDPPRPREDAVDVAEVGQRCHAREHRIFGGRIDSTRLGFGQRAILAALRVPDGDYRDWTEIREWARKIARDLANEPG
jgi:menaquinone-dependent protoporphyrinogen oxidase